jgi:hypothetical protein
MSPALALADDATYSAGARVGGYGFRRSSSDGQPSFDQCRMSGLGIFAQRTLGRRAFVETGVDLYSSQPGEDQDLPLDRSSALITAAIGVRSHFTRHIDGYAQLGAGVELTRVSVPYADGAIRDQLALPLGFIGMGADVRFGARTHLGAAFRVHAMGNFDYAPERLEMETGWTRPPSADEVFAASPAVAAQGQFYLRRDL